MCPEPSESSNHLVAVDLGSNSFHLVVAEQLQGKVVLLDRIRERVGLAEGLNADGTLDANAAERALNCLRRFGVRLEGTQASRVRCVGTAIFRDMRDGRNFLARAEKCLGHEIETLPGKEEARLIYLGVAHSIGDDSEARLVIDIGGGSTEIILGSQFESKMEVSLPLGCVYQSTRYFTDGALTPQSFQQAILSARIEISPVAEDLQNRPWKQCIGASGTVLAVAKVLKQNYGGDGTITAAGVDVLIADLCAAGTVHDLDLLGLREDREGVIAGGLSILRALFHEIEIEFMGTAKGALREGLLYDLVGRLQH
ncbi:MAG: exopolyphosphatase/guanosine-5'-triphosphate,3'-diphosphate pyrophosphatase [Glaciecola sp.]|jgi:exopolyphosphatase/guanosine-5'-triphosphate,3'-diphosphate pyrophosphatase